MLLFVFFTFRISSLKKKTVLIASISILLNLETITNQNDKEIPKEKCISPEKRQTIIDNLDINITV